MEIEGVASKKRKMNTKLNILDLPNECLAEIFQYLRLSDLVSTYQTCKRFQAVSKYSFSKKYKTVGITSITADAYSIASSEVYDFSSPEDYKSSPDDTEKELSLNELTKVYWYFGNLIEWVIKCSCNIELNVTPFLNILNTNATANLKHLHLVDKIWIDISQFDNLARLFARLEKLKIEFCFNNAIMRELLRRCKNLTELSIRTDKTIDETILRNVTPKIEKVFYKYNNSVLSSEDTCEFLKTHPNLKSVRIFQMCLPNTFDLKYLENIETLLLDTRCVNDFNEMNLIDLFQLKSLKQLELITTKQDFSDILSKIQLKPPTDIETFAMNIAHFGNVYNLLNAFTFRSLKKLVVSGAPVMLLSNVWLIDSPDFEATENQVKNLATCLVSVEELHFMKFNIYFMSTIIYFVKHFRNLKILVLDTYIDFTVEHLIQIADAQRNKNNKNERLIVRYTRCLDTIVEKALEENPKKFNMMDFTPFSPCILTELDHFHSFIY